MKISFIIPSLNEEKAIGKVIDEIKSLNFKSSSYEILIIDGNSVDNTRQIAKSKGAKVIIEARKGYGRAYKTGFKEAKGDIIITGDADCTYPFKDSKKFIMLLNKNNLEFITTNRFFYMDKKAMSLSHKFGNFILTFVLRALFFLNIKDSQSGMWIFKKEILNDLNLTSDGMPLSEEIKIEAFSKVVSKEIPIIYRAREGDVKLNTLRDGALNLFFLFKKRFLLRK